MADGILLFTQRQRRTAQEVLQFTTEQRLYAALAATRRKESIAIYKG